MLEPKKAKHRKQHRRRGMFSGTAHRETSLAFGSVGLKAMSNGEITARQIEAARRAMTHSVQRGGKIWVRVFPDVPVTKKAAEVPMGSGKGTPEYWARVVKAGTILFEMDGLSVDAAREALRLAGFKLPFKTKVVTRIAHS
ncbi:50S ribosomal protein L16 [Candidatus Peribacteria bacterium RIFOXYC2_FULL_55_14]|nr:MAG: 50S ribosomal protein L16 [Candidatus Peribacteria bacterium GW2011_GWC2_54_8]OGJ71738.1 MAG: 50S ribosomal protein L16 [Candidatus Peribacteria bacterium RIFOXYA1_FULL_56_14]OGJ73349.1 MAG: 50S ribosomal protein L16 [Candidatus Peribacteria bacterium RIFOXYA2_FULL_55_28]OGJ74531.1 MAG: 50S ribosomal protein L16 [Candidatus Peribacteria bacterium RIFOXYB1_FULL_54_35]OGJ77577.1 MAG: 50S ribosomal protein L16 [Candidatus Peribacteria bacterium RIFOXYB2_FULL_54_17]OGJ78693.1 MAG: 50S ribo